MLLSEGVELGAGLGQAGGAVLGRLVRDLGPVRGPAAACG